LAAFKEMALNNRTLSAWRYADQESAELGN